jgi:flavin-dependent thymidylate synthase
MANAKHSNTVELIGTYGGDESHAMSAWTSTSRDIDTPDPKTGKNKRERIQPLLTMLASSGHGTPFEKSTIHFLCVTDIASHIHLLKHRHLSINAESARYKELKDDKFYVPSDWSVSQRDDYEKFMTTALAAYHRALKSIESDLIQGGMDKKLAKKRAKESARFYLPYGNQIACDVSFNFRSFYHFLGLRYHVDAQKEIRDIARKMLEQVHQQGDFNKTLVAFGLLDEATNTLRGPFEGSHNG